MGKTENKTNQINTFKKHCFDILLEPTYIVSDSTKKLL